MITNRTIQGALQMNNKRIANLLLIVIILFTANLLINNHHAQANTINIFLCGGMFIFSIYHLSSFTIRPKDCSLLYLGLLSLIIALRALLVGDVFLASLFPSYNLEIVTTFEYLTIPLGIVSFTMFIYHLYPDRFPPFTLKVIQGVTLLFSVITIFMPRELMIKFSVIYQVFFALIFFILLYILFTAMQEKDEGSQTILAGSTILLITILLDAAYAKGLHTTESLSNTLPAGLLVFIFLLSLTMNMKLSNALDIFQSLKADLERQLKTKEREAEMTGIQPRMDAVKDPLTTLYNREELENIIYTENTKYGKLLQVHIRYAIICVKLDDFKNISKEFRQQTSDSVLNEFAQILTKAVRGTDMVFRYGDDDFVILMPDANMEGALSLTKRIVARTKESKTSFAEKVAEKIDVNIIPDDQSLVSCSIGIAYHTPGTHFNLKSLFWKAHKAMTQTKKTARYCICISTDEGIRRYQ